MDNIFELTINNVTKAFSLEQGEIDQLKAAPVPRLIAALPYIAGCPEAERIAATHLAVYLLSIKTEVGHANEADNSDILTRLERISYYPGGDTACIKKGMSLLALAMLSNYNNDTEADTAEGKYNPVAAGAFDYETEKAALIETIKGIQCPDIDAVMTVEDGLRGWWDS